MIYKVGIHGHGWVWSDTVEADSPEEAVAKVEAKLSKNEITTYVEEVEE